MYQVREFQSSPRRLELYELDLRLRPGPGAAQTLVQGDPGLPAELSRGLRDVEHRPADVAEPCLRELGIDVDAGRARAGPVRVENRRLHAGADVERPAGLADRREQRRDDVVHEDEVARLEPVAEDHRRLPLREALEEDRDDAALEAGVLPWPVDVREPQHGVPRRVDAIPAEQVLL